MELPEALRILKALADGVDPETGEVFSKDSPYQNPQSIRALAVAVQTVEETLARQQKKTALPQSAGRPWSKEEDQQLMEGHESGMTIRQLAIKHQRTDGAIQSRLIKLGKLPPLRYSASPGTYR
jgi:hypothetical protein